MSATGNEIHPEDSARRIAGPAIEFMRGAIADTGGREVFFAGTTDRTGRVIDVRVCARGNENAVPALFASLQIRDVVIHNHPSGNLAPSAADLELAAMYSTHGHGVFIVDNEVAHAYVVVEPFAPDTAKRLEQKELHACLGSRSRLARALPDFEVRPQQTAMTDTVSAAFNQDGIAVIEAPTGVGKTLSYLLPAALWAVRNKERVVISTRTINLQEQIILKDIPLLQRSLDEPFTSCLVKGRGNYLCLRKFERLLSEADLFDDEAYRAQLDALTQWIEHTSDGSKEDLPFVPERELWDRVCSESDTCSMGRCPNQQRCFVGKARRQVAKADLIVVNHHMLFSDLAIKRELGDFSALSVLPAYQRLIFDEAHSIEDSATEYLGASAHRFSTMAVLGRFLRIERGQERGLIPLIRLKLVKECPQLSVDRFEAIQGHVDEALLPALATAREALTGAFDAIRALTAAKCSEMGRDIKWRLTPEALADAEVREVHAVTVLPAAEAVTQFCRHCAVFARRLDEIPPGENEVESPLALEKLQLNAYATRLQRTAAVLAESLGPEIEENTVRWIEIDAENAQQVRVARCPLEVGRPLAEWLYANLKTVVMTSATLTVRHSFDYLFERIGLDQCDQNRVQTQYLDSPFDFEAQALLGIVTDLRPPTERGYLDEAIDAIRDALRITRGRAFVLFTSFSSLEYCFRRLRDDLAREGIRALKQGTSTRTQLLDEFRRDVSSVLFAVDSFWEGVDVAGEALQCVILPRLPFRVPTEPVLEARAEAIDARGGNSFLSYSVPQAVIKFRQGFGRLIRRRTDRGAVLVLDRRIITKHYGRVFVESLPEARITRGGRSEVLDDLRQFFEEAD